VGRVGRRTWSTRVVYIAIITQQLHQQQAANQEGGGEEKSKITKMEKNWYHTKSTLLKEKLYGKKRRFQLRSLHTRHAFTCAPDTKGAKNYVLQIL
jgi:hypothetical protein